MLSSFQFQGGEFARTSANIELKYDDPHPGFDRSKVYGAACKLFKVKDPKFNVALDGVAGGRVRVALLLKWYG